MRQRIQVKTPEQLARMREAGLVVARTLAVLRDAVRPGISTQELDEIAAATIRSEGAVPSFLGYLGYPATICASVNEVIVHGIPRPDRVLRDGDIISIDCGAILDGWHGDAAITVGVGEIDPADQALLDACRAALRAGIERAMAGGRLGDISHAVERSVAGSGDYGLIREYTGHGIGTEMHMDPAVPNYGPPGRGPRLRAGMALAIEPMITRGSRHSTELDDGWTVVTADGSRAAHFEHTIAITPDGPWVLTAENQDHYQDLDTEQTIPSPQRQAAAVPRGSTMPPGDTPDPGGPHPPVHARSRSEDIGHAPVGHRSDAR
ncbi:MAG: type I methionyl aminopeptidase [Nocardiopsaceae bacterium]|nr:type I methionyl aminopeptidase [Nocardiopsaceae bacterium]